MNRSLFFTIYFVKNQKRPVVLGVWDVIERLWISQQYLRKLVKQGKIAHQEISSWVVFLEDDIIAFENQRNERAKKDPRIKIK